MSLLANSNAIESGGYNIDRSLRFRSSASAYFNRTNTASGNAQKFTISMWFKRGLINYGTSQYLFLGSDYYTGANRFQFSINIRPNIDGDVDKLSIDMENTLSGTNAILRTAQVFRDPSAWYNIILGFDLTHSNLAI